MTLPNKVLTRLYTLGDTILEKITEKIQNHNTDENAHSIRFNNYVLKTDKSNHNHGKITSDGGMDQNSLTSNVGEILVTDSATKKIRTVSTLPSTKVQHQSLDSKVSVSQGIGYAGYFLKIDSNGNVVPEEVDVGSDYTANEGIKIQNNVIKHTNNINSLGSAGFIKIAYDEQGHITGASPVQQQDISSLGIPISDTTYVAGSGLLLDTSNGINTFKHENTLNNPSNIVSLMAIRCDSEGHVMNMRNVTSQDLSSIQGVSITDTTYDANNGIRKDNNVFGHSNSINSQNLQNSTLQKIAFDSYGHITETTTATGSDLPSHSHNFENIVFQNGHEPIVSNDLVILLKRLKETYRTPLFSSYVYR